MTYVLHQGIQLTLQLIETTGYSYANSCYKNQKGKDLIVNEQSNHRLLTNLSCSVKNHEIGLHFQKSLTLNLNYEINQIIHSQDSFYCLFSL